MILQGVEAAAGSLAGRLFGTYPHLSRLEAVRPIWEAWQAGDFATVRSLAADSLSQRRAVDEARHLLALAASVSGEHRVAIDIYRHIGRSYRGIAELDAQMLWSHIRLGDIAGAWAFARSRGLERDRVIAARLRLAVERPLQVEIAGTVEIPFTDDELSAVMPGVAAELNGHPVVARLDTGGAFIHLSSEQAKRLGVSTVASERSFAALSWHKTSYGTADLDLGPIRIRNAPVTVHDSGLPSQQIASAFGVDLGPIVGTNFLEQFFSTIDGPGQRLLLSHRGDSGARHSHLSRLPDAAGEIPFAICSEHLMLAKVNPGNGVQATFFVDSGLVMVNPEQGQASMLVPARTLDQWKVPRPLQDRFADCPGPVTFGPITRDGMTAHVVSDRTWGDFGDWAGIRVDGLISWGFLKETTWTLDFDRQHFLFGQA